MTLPQMIFAASGGKPKTPRLKFESYEAFAEWRREM